MRYLDAVHSLSLSRPFRLSFHPLCVSLYVRRLSERIKSHRFALILDFIFSLHSLVVVIFSISVFALHTERN
jgi:hypothetical protein